MPGGAAVAVVAAVAGKHSQKLAQSIFGARKVSTQFFCEMTWKF